jgi:hypothetical protein
MYICAKTPTVKRITDVDESTHNCYVSQLSWLFDTLNNSF